MKLLLVLTTLISLNAFAEDERERFHCRGSNLDITLHEEINRDKMPIPHFEYSFRGNVSGTLNGQELPYLPVSVDVLNVGGRENYTMQPIWHGHFNHFFKLYANFDNINSATLRVRDLSNNVITYGDIECRLLF